MWFAEKRVSSIPHDGCVRAAICKRTEGVRIADFEQQRTRVRAKRPIKEEGEALLVFRAVVFSALSRKPKSRPPVTLSYAYLIADSHCEKVL